MNLRSIFIGFAAGFAVATVLGLALVVPVIRQSWKVNVDSDVYRGIQGALDYVEKSARDGDCKKAAAQLALFNKRFAEYRAGGPAPEEWWQEVIAATQPVE